MRDEIIHLEKKFWQALVDQDVDTATSLLCEPAVMASPHGAMQFDHAGYRKMAEQGPMVVTAYEFSEVNAVFPNDSTAVLTYRVRQTVASRGQEGGNVQEMIDSSTWVKHGSSWLCAIHTESPAAAKPARS